MAAGLLALPLLTAAVLCPTHVQAQSTGVLTATLTDLYDFSGGSDGEDLRNAPVQGSDGNLYGTTVGGGDANGDGTIYRITPSGVLTTLHRFTGSDGANPYGGLVQGSDGYLYGTTTNFGPNGAVGTVFRISQSGAFTTLYGFTGGSDGQFPEKTLVQSSDGNFYGTTSGAGANSFGTVFKITPAGVLTTLASFTGNEAGYFGSLTQGRDGNFYGVDPLGGSNGVGAVYQVTPAGGLTTLYNFTGDTDGKEPGSTLLLGADGNFYGTTSAGGTDGDGTVYQITPTGAFTTLHSFSGGGDGATPYANLIAGPGGAFFGTTSSGGSNGDGTVFEITPTGMLTPLYNFHSSNADLAFSTPVLGSDGNFYFTNGGTGGIYQLSITGGLSSSGSVQLDTAADNVAEGAGSITVAVSRTGGSAGAISVNYATVDDTALAGTDYQATSGTLSWADGDTADKTITVPILNRVLASGSTLFLVNLSAPAGGALLGAPVQEGVTILDTASTANIQSVTLLSPPAGITISQNKSVAVQADVEALSGTLANVEIFVLDSASNSVDLGGFTTERGRVTWTPTVAGSFTLQVVATDTGGNTQQTTSAVTVAAAADAAIPQTNLDGNLDSITVALNAPVPVVVQAVDSAGNALQNVQFYLDGVPVVSSPVTAVRQADSKAADAGAGTLFVTNAIASKLQQLLTVVGTTASGVSSVSTPVTIYAKAEAGTPPSAAVSNLASGASVPVGTRRPERERHGHQRQPAPCQGAARRRQPDRGHGHGRSLHLQPACPGGWLARHERHRHGPGRPEQRVRSRGPQGGAGRLHAQLLQRSRRPSPTACTTWRSPAARPSATTPSWLGPRLPLPLRPGLRVRLRRGRRAQRRVLVRLCEWHVLLHQSRVPVPVPVRLQPEHGALLLPGPHQRPGRYNTDGTRFFYDFNTSSIITK